MAVKILVVEDEPAIREMLQHALTQAGYQIAAVGSVREAQQSMVASLPDLILLDWMLPDTSGVEFAKRLKKEETTRQLPIIMLTARGEESDKIRGLEVGADDYVTKPFSPRELGARIKAVLRRVSPQVSEEVLSVEGLTLDMSSHRVTAGDATVELGPTEFKLLHFFMTHPERVYSRNQVLDHVWGGNVYIEERTVDVHIRRLRKALEATQHDHLIQTVRGAGYRFSTKV